ncbi:hypothetical protein BV902_00765 [Sphingobacterium sp. B29]|uniref:hypothetical protein n=1 Tax=Sphingobacterium sp. B29 TaxID=1933220 RepID=UPI000958428D|nr:hypothetical protein [Sphingobacterium sp. B29]APU95037.1 hypothetical protein BV902_00765 [Sphingobacterium sp. B29]
MRDSFWFLTTGLRRRWQKGYFPKICSRFLSLPPVRASAQDTGKGKGAQESTKVVREWQCSPIPATESQAQQTDGDRAERWHRKDTAAQLIKG